METRVAVELVDLGDTFDKCSLPFCSVQAGGTMIDAKMSRPFHIVVRLIRLSGDRAVVYVHVSPTALQAVFARTAHAKGLWIWTLGICTDSVQVCYRGPTVTAIDAHSFAVVPQNLLGGGSLLLIVLLSFQECLKGLWRNFWEL